MPVFYYLSESEAADVYQYLTLYPPNQSPVVDPAAPMPVKDHAATEVKHGEEPLNGSLFPNNEPRPSKDADMGMAALPYVAGLFVILLLAGGAYTTVREFKRLSAESAHRKWAVRNARVGPLQKATVVFSAELMNINPEELCAKSEKFHATASGL